LVNEKYCATELAGGRVRNLRLIHVPSRVHVILVGRVSESLNHVYSGLYFQTDVVNFDMGLLDIVNETINKNNRVFIDLQSF
jgi:hypothetical protein